MASREVAAQAAHVLELQLPALSYEANTFRPQPKAAPQPSLKFNPGAAEFEPIKTSSSASTRTTITSGSSSNGIGGRGQSSPGNSVFTAHSLAELRAGAAEFIPGTLAPDTAASGCHKAAVVETGGGTEGRTGEGAAEANEAEEAGWEGWDNPAGADPEQAAWDDVAAAPAEDSADMADYAIQYAEEEEEEEGPPVGTDWACQYAVMEDEGEGEVDQEFDAWEAAADDDELAQGEQAAQILADDEEEAGEADGAWSQLPNGQWYCVCGGQWWGAGGAADAPHRDEGRANAEWLAEADGSRRPAVQSAMSLSAPVLVPSSQQPATAAAAGLPAADPALTECRPALNASAAIFDPARPRPQLPHNHNSLRATAPAFAAGSRALLASVAELPQQKALRATAAEFVLAAGQQQQQQQQATAVHPDAVSSGIEEMGSLGLELDPASGGCHRGSSSSEAGAGAEASEAVLPQEPASRPEHSSLRASAPEFHLHAGPEAKHGAACSSSPAPAGSVSQTAVVARLAFLAAALAASGGRLGDTASPGESPKGCGSAAASSPQCSALPPTAAASAALAQEVSSGECNRAAPVAELPGRLALRPSAATFLPVVQQPGATRAQPAPAAAPAPALLPSRPSLQPSAPAFLLPSPQLQKSPQLASRAGVSAAPPGRPTPLRQPFASAASAARTSASSSEGSTGNVSGSKDPSTAPVGPGIAGAIAEAAGKPPASSGAAAARQGVSQGGDTSRPTRPLALFEPAAVSGATVLSRPASCPDLATLAKASGGQQRHLKSKVLEGTVTVGGSVASSTGAGACSAASAARWAASMAAHPSGGRSSGSDSRSLPSYEVKTVVVAAAGAAGKAAGVGRAEARVLAVPRAPGKKAAPARDSPTPSSAAVPVPARAAAAAAVKRAGEGAAPSKPLQPVIAGRADGSGTAQGIAQPAAGLAPPEATSGQHLKRSHLAGQSRASRSSSYSHQAAVQSCEMEGVWSTAKYESITKQHGSTPFANPPTASMHQSQSATVDDSCAAAAPSAALGVTVADVSMRQELPPVPAASQLLQVGQQTLKAAAGERKVEAPLRPAAVPAGPHAEADQAQQAALARGRGAKSASRAVWVPVGHPSHAAIEAQASGAKLARSRRADKPAAARSAAGRSKVLRMEVPAAAVGHQPVECSQPACGSRASTKPDGSGAFGRQGAVPACTAAGPSCATATCAPASWSVSSSTTGCQPGERKPVAGLAAESALRRQDMLMVEGTPAGQQQQRQHQQQQQHAQVQRELQQQPQHARSQQQQRHHEQQQQQHVLVQPQQQPVQEQHPLLEQQEAARLPAIPHPPSGPVPGAFPSQLVHLLLPKVAPSPAATVAPAAGAAAPPTEGPAAGAPALFAAAGAPTTAAETIAANRPGQQASSYAGSPSDCSQRGHTGLHQSGHTDTARPPVAAVDTLPGQHSTAVPPVGEAVSKQVAASSSQQHPGQPPMPLPLLPQSLPLSPQQPAQQYALHNPSQEEDEADECIFCWDADRTAVLVPCGHLVLCGFCANRMFGPWSKKRDCPMCRAKVQSFVVIGKT